MQKVIQPVINVLHAGSRLLVIIRNWATLNAHLTSFVMLVNMNHTVLGSYVALLLMVMSSTKTDICVLSYVDTEFITNFLFDIAM